MKTVKFIGGAINTRGTFAPGDTLTGKEKDLRPIVESGTAEWVDAAPPLRRKRKLRKPERIKGAK